MPVFDFLNDSRKPQDKKLEDIPIERITPNPNQPRAVFDDDSIAELAQSIEQVGLIQPLLVRRSGDSYELVAGERRLRALKLLGRRLATCVVQDEVEEESSAMMALIENLQREDLHYLEEARSYETLLTTYNLTQEELAARLGRSQSSIANKLRILRLDPAVKESMVAAGFSERHARALLKLREPDQQLKIIERASAKRLSVKETEKLVEKTLDRLYDEHADGAKPRPIMVRMVKDYRLFMNTVNSAVAQLRESGMTVEVEQTDIDGGVDIHLVIKK